MFHAVFTDDGFQHRLNYFKKKERKWLPHGYDDKKQKPRTLAGYGLWTLIKFMQICLKNKLNISLYLISLHDIYFSFISFVCLFFVLLCFFNETILLFDVWCSQKCRRFCECSLKIVFLWLFEKQEMVSTNLLK